jgi:hypothetical protein
MITSDGTVQPSGSGASRRTGFRAALAGARRFSQASASPATVSCAWHEEVHGSAAPHTICATCAESQAAVFEALPNFASRSRRRTLRSFASGAAW